MQQAGVLMGLPQAMCSRCGAEPLQSVLWRSALRGGYDEK